MRKINFQNFAKDRQANDWLCLPRFRVLLKHPTKHAQGWEKLVHRLCIYGFLGQNRWDNAVDSYRLAHQDTLQLQTASRESVPHHQYHWSLLQLTPNSDQGGSACRIGRNADCNKIWGNLPTAAERLRIHLRSDLLGRRYPRNGEEYPFRTWFRYLIDVIVSLLGKIRENSKIRPSHFFLVSIYARAWIAWLENELIQQFITGPFCYLHC